MKTNLSSQIKLDRIPKRYYAPDGELELAALTGKKFTPKSLKALRKGRCM